MTEERPKLSELWADNLPPQRIQMYSGERYRVPWLPPVDFTKPIELTPEKETAIVAEFRFERLGHRDWALLGRWTDRDAWQSLGQWTS